MLNIKHMCPDWDFMLIGPNDPEWRECFCGGYYEEDLCGHEEHDHGICSDCGEDVTDFLISKIDFFD